MKIVIKVLRILENGGFSEKSRRRFDKVMRIMTYQPVECSISMPKEITLTCINIYQHEIKTGHFELQSPVLLGNPFTYQTWYLCIL